MPTSARASLGFFGRFADVGIRAPEQSGLSQQALTTYARLCVPLNQLATDRPENRDLTPGQSVLLS